MTCKDLIVSLQSGAYDPVLTSLYALNGAQESLDHARQRAIDLIETFCINFDLDKKREAALFSGPGRTELGGNHTDHQHGHVLCASVDLDMLACAAPNGTESIRILSEGYPALEIDMGSLLPRAEERNTSAALVRGVAAKILELGYPVGGFDACITSDVLSGSGLSSSAAFEVLIGNVINTFFCAGELDAVQIAKIGQYAENIFFGKPCGLMDQMASSIGGVVAIDFTDPAAPNVERVEFDLLLSGHALCIVDTGSCHSDLTEDYSDITREMGAVAAFFEKEYLRDIAETDFYSSIPALRAVCGDRAVLRAIHFFEDDARAVRQAQALKTGNVRDFLALVNASGLSSALHLQNTWSPAEPTQQAIPVALTIGRRMLDGTGAIRVHGGGFAGTIQAFVPNEKVFMFKAGMEKLFGTGKCHVLRIRPCGGCCVIR